MLTEGDTQPAGVAQQPDLPRLLVPCGARTSSRASLAAPTTISSLFWKWWYSEARSPELLGQVPDAERVDALGVDDVQRGLQRRALEISGIFDAPLALLALCGDRRASRSRKTDRSSSNREPMVGCSRRAAGAGGNSAARGLAVNAARRSVSRVSSSSGVCTIAVINPIVAPRRGTARRTASTPLLSDDRQARQQQGGCCFPTSIRDVTEAASTLLRRA